MHKLDLFIMSTRPSGKTTKSISNMWAIWQYIGNQPYEKGARMPKYTFTKDRDLENHFDDTTVKIECFTESRDNLIEAFEDFLGACGFGPKRIELDMTDEIEDKE